MKPHRSVNALVVLALVLSAVTTTGYSPLLSSLIGRWQAIDPADGSDMSLVVGGPPGGPFNITWTEDYLSLCGGEAGIGRGTGTISPDDPYRLDAHLDFECFTTGATAPYDTAWLYHPMTDSLTQLDGYLTTWRHPGPPATGPALGLRVNYGHDWAESFYEAGHTVRVIVTESDRVTVKATAEFVTEPKDFWGGEPGFASQPEDWDPAQPDFQPYDWVYGIVDNGQTAQVQLGEISGEIDLEQNAITGTISAPWFAEEVAVECLDWFSPTGSLNKDAGSIQANGEASYLCDWDSQTEWDLEPGQTVGVGYLGPDGHWVADAFSVLPLGFYIHYDEDLVEGSYELGHMVLVTVLDGDGGTKAEISVPTVEMPHWGGAPGFRIESDDWPGAPPDIEPGDVVRGVVDDGLLTTEVRIGEIAAEIDIEANSISGTIDAEWAGETVTVVCWPWGGPEGTTERNTEVVPDGVSTFTCTWDSEWDIQSGEWVGVEYYGSAPHSVSRGFVTPAVIAVTGTEDVLANDGFCTLREAVIAASTNTPSGDAPGECPAGLDWLTDTIVLADGDSYSLSIDSTQEDGAQDGDLDVWDNSAALDLVVTVPEDGLATISQDAAVDDRVWDVLGASVQMRRLTISGGSGVDLGGGIKNEGTLAVESSTISGNSAAAGGGGLWSSGMLTVEATTVSGNSAAFGGGIVNRPNATLTVIASTVANNLAAEHGGGIVNRADGVVTIDSSAISENTATNDGGGGIYNEGVVAIGNSAVSGNTAGGDGGGVINLPNATLTMGSSTVAGNTATWSGGGLITLAGGTLTVDASTVSGNSAGYGAGISNSGGTLTLTNSEVSGNSASGDAGGIHNRDGGTTVVESGSAISGNTAPSGGGIGNWAGAVTLRNSTVAGNSADVGGGLNNGDTATVTGSEITGNTATWAGGGINNGLGTLVVEGDSLIRGNSSEVFGGGIMNSGALTVTGSIVTGNTTPVKGGGIANEGDLTIEDALLSANVADQGGGLYNFGTAFVGGGTTVEGNTAGGGGGLFNTNTMTVENSAVSGNQADYGGGLFNWIGGMLTIHASTISGNTANQGGGLHNKEESTTVIENSTISGNSATWIGGGLQNWGTLSVTGSALLGNTAADGGAILSDVGIENATSVTASCIVGNADTAVLNNRTATQIATGNWWGDASGPSGVGPGTGDSVGDYFDFSGWLTEPLPICSS